MEEKGVLDCAAATWQTLLSVCRQDWVSSNFTEEHFPLEPTPPDEAEWEVYEHHFEETVCGEEAFRRLEKLGYRFCGPRRAMEFIAAHADIQDSHSLLVTARWQDPSGYRYAPVFGRFDVRRGLNLGFLGSDFGPDCGWLVLRKRG